MLTVVYATTAADCYLQDLNSPDYTGVTPLHLACSLQDWEAVNVLLDLKVSTFDNNCMLSTKYVRFSLYDMMIRC
jgi:ankyrin repeat protein